jgi:hypothetical protein
MFGLHRPLLVVLAIACALAVAVVLRSLRAPRWVREGVCGHCKYESSGQARCSECGAELKRGGLATPYLALRLGAGPVTLALALLLLLTVLGTLAYAWASRYITESGDRRVQIFAELTHSASSAQVQPYRVEYKVDAVYSSSGARRGTITIAIGPRIFVQTPAYRAISPDLPKAVIRAGTGTAEIYDTQGTLLESRLSFGEPAASALYRAAGLDPEVPFITAGLESLVRIVEFERQSANSGLSGHGGAGVPGELGIQSSSVGTSAVPPETYVGLDGPTALLAAVTAAAALLFAAMYWLILGRRSRLLRSLADSGATD